MRHAVFYTHQTSGACAGVCTCKCTHQMEKTVSCEVCKTVKNTYFEEHLQTTASTGVL